VVGMEYEVCTVVVSLSFLRIDMYKTVEDYERGRPAMIYVILRRTSLLSRSEVYEVLRDYAVEVIDENDENAIRVYNECKRARHFISIPPLLPAS
jgi:hypothetical protein